MSAQVLVNSQQPHVTRDLLSKLDVNGPRYTSYPTADRFVEAFGPAQYQQALSQRSQGALGGAAMPLSVYVHIPFCESVCYYCACNKVITKHHERSHEYLEALQTEIDLHVAQLGRGQPVSQVHFGGGSPTFLSDDELERLLSMLQTAFRFVPGGEYSIEVDPRTVDAGRRRSACRRRPRGRRRGRSRRRRARPRRARSGRRWAGQRWSEPGWSGRRCALPRPPPRRPARRGCRPRARRRADGRGSRRRGPCRRRGPRRRRPLRCARARCRPRGRRRPRRARPACRRGPRRRPRWRRP